MDFLGGNVDFNNKEVVEFKKRYVEDSNKDFKFKVEVIKNEGNFMEEKGEVVEGNNGVLIEDKNLENIESE